jgi:hypothetical protein
MSPDPSLEPGRISGTNKRKLQYFQEFLELKFGTGTESEIDQATLQGIIKVTLDIAPTSSTIGTNPREVLGATSKLRNKCSAALSLYSQPNYREIYMEQLSTILPALRELISLL